MKILAIAVVGLVPGAFASQAAQAQAISEDAAVYAAALDSVFAEHSAQRLIVRASTDDGARIDVQVQARSELLDSMPAIEPSTRDDFPRVNRSPAIIREIAETRISVEIVPDSVIDALRNVVPSGPPPAGPPELVNYWRAFHERFPNSAGLTRLSRIAYSDDRDQAVVQVDHGCGAFCGEASVVLLQKTEDAWRVVSIASLWVY